jgi:hypothetical protein
VFWAYEHATASSPLGRLFFNAGMIYSCSSVSLKTFGSVSKPCTPGEHQNSWKMDVHPPKNGINRY